VHGFFAVRVQPFAVRRKHCHAVLHGKESLPCRQAFAVRVQDFAVPPKRCRAALQGKDPLPCISAWQRLFSCADISWVSRIGHN
jgi:hypothetical protein